MYVGTAVIKMPDFKCMFLFASTFVLGIVALNCMFSNIEMEKRLSKTEEALHKLQLQIDVLSKLANIPKDVSDVSTLKSTLLSGNMQDNTVAEQTQDTHIWLRHRRAAKRGKGNKKDKKDKKKKCKNCLPSVEFEGSGAGYQPEKDINDVSGLWTSASWMANGKSGPFKYDKIYKNGMVEIKKAGLYIVYAQITIKEQGIGFDIKKRVASGDKILASCTCRPTEEDSFHSCFTMKIVTLDKNDSIYVKEKDTSHMKRTLGLYSSSASYFGAVRIGNST